VVLHDETLNRTTDCSGRVDRTTARRLRRCNAAHGFGKFGFQNVPTLDEALRFITTRSRHVKLYVHAKTVEDDHEADAIMSVMRRWQLADNPRATLLADNPDYLYLLQDSGARSLGLVFHDFDKDYALRSDWPVLFAWEAHLTASDLAEAARHGRLLLVSRDHPQSLEALLRMGVTAISVDDPTQTLRQLGRLPDN
jgi:glycerophosphoryl diester phosphodiesterase